MMEEEGGGRMGCRHSRPLVCFHASNIRTVTIRQISKSYLSLSIIIAFASVSIVSYIYHS